MALGHDRFITSNSGGPQGSYHFSSALPPPACKCKMGDRSNIVTWQTTKIQRCRGDSALTDFL